MLRSINDRAVRQRRRSAGIPKPTLPGPGGKLDVGAKGAPVPKDENKKPLLVGGGEDNPLAEALLRDVIDRSPGVRLAGLPNVVPAAPALAPPSPPLPASRRRRRAGLLRRHREPRRRQAPPQRGDHPPDAHARVLHGPPRALARRPALRAPGHWEDASRQSGAPPLPPRATTRNAWLLPAAPAATARAS